MGAVLRFTVHERTIPGPQFSVPPATHASDADGYHGTMGIHGDLMEGARIAVRAMLSWLGEEHGLAREDAYVLASLAGDLRIHEIVDAGVWNVGSRFRGRSLATGSECRAERLRGAGARSARRPLRRGRVLPGEMARGQVPVGSRFQRRLVLRADRLG